MKTIEERAEKWGKDYPKLPKSELPYTDSDIEAVATNSFLQGAAYQRGIDIKKGVEWLCDNIIEFVEFDHLNGIQIDYGQLNNEFRKAMEL